MKRRAFQTDAQSRGERLDAFLARQLEWPAERAAALVQAGAVYVRGKRARDPGQLLEPGLPIVAVLEEAGSSVLERAEPSLTVGILHEDEAILAVDKPAGMNAQPTAGKVGGSLVDWADAHLEAQGLNAGLVHRLDRETSGVTVFGKTPQATTRLAAEFRLGTAKKTYLAVVKAGIAPDGEIDLPLSKDPARPGRWRATRQANGIPARTRFERLAERDGFAIVALYPETGRTHQLRAHLTALGFPIAGDARYGGAKALGGHPAPRCLLHARTLRLHHPATGAPLNLQAPVPPDLARFLDAASVTAP